MLLSKLQPVNLVEELRKLKLEEMGVKRKYHKTDIIQEHTSKASELYGPLMRNGENPKRWHQVIDEKMQRYKAQFIGNVHTNYNLTITFISAIFLNLKELNSLVRYHVGWIKPPN